MSVSGIAEFFSGKRVFLTGGSGFVGKCLAWKLLRSCPDVEKVYLLIRGRSDQEFRDKFQNLIQSKAFDIIHKENPRMISKLEGVHGDITKSLCGLNSDQLKKIEGAQIFIHSAAATHFFMRLPKTIQINAGGTRNVLDLAQRVTDVKAFVHVSTAFNMPPGSVDEKVYPMDVEPEDALEFFAKIPADWNTSITKLILKDKINTYAYSKHIAERLVERAGNNLPVSIVRPGGITSGMTEPLPGWNETQSSSSKWAKLLFSGAYHTVLANSQGRFELTPVDYAVNTCLAAAWRVGTDSPKKLHVYNCVPNYKSNPMMLRDLINWGCETTRESLNVKKYENYYPIISKHTGIFDVSNFLFRKIPGQLWSLMNLGSYQNFQKDYKEAQLIARTFKPVTTENWEFDTSNMVELNERMDLVDRRLFPIDFDQIDWKRFIEYLAHGVYSCDKQPDTSDNPSKVPSPGYNTDILKIPQGVQIIDKNF